MFRNDILVGKRRFAVCAVSTLGFAWWLQFAKE